MREVGLKKTMRLTSAATMRSTLLGLKPRKAAPMSPWTTYAMLVHRAEVNGSTIRRHSKVSCAHTKSNTEMQGSAGWSKFIVHVINAQPLH